MELTFLNISNRIKIRYYLILFMGVFSTVAGITVFNESEFNMLYKVSIILIVWGVSLMLLVYKDKRYLQSFKTYLFYGALAVGEGLLFLIQNNNEIHELYLFIAAITFLFICGLLLELYNSFYCYNKNKRVTFYLIILNGILLSVFLLVSVFISFFLFPVNLIFCN